MTFLFTPTANSQETGTIKIGLLLQDKNWVAAKNGAELAITEANKTASKIRFELVVKSMEGAWGAGGNEAINLIFDDKVIALVGSHDGRNAHLVEQASTKSGVVFISAWAGDPTLSQAFVPWFFNIVPNNNQQAEVLVKEIYSTQNLKNVAVVSDTEYDSKSACKSFMQKAKTEGQKPVEFVTDSLDENLHNTLHQIISLKPDGLVLFVKPVLAKKIVSEIKGNKLQLKIFGPLHLLNENEIKTSDLQNLENLFLISSGHWFNSGAKTFTENYLNKLGSMPGCTDAYSFDAVKTLTQAIAATGADREKIQNHLSRKTFQGVTGSFKFDERGNRTGDIILIQIKNGVPVEITR